MSKYDLKASSLSNTIFLCLMISIFCGCLVLVSHYQNILNSRLELQEELIRTNTSSFNYFLGNVTDVDLNTKIEIDLFENDIKTEISRKKWGFYDVIICKSIFKQDTISKSALIGFKKDNNEIALYATDYDKPLKAAGKSVFSGELKVPNGKIEQSFIDNKTKNNIKINGNQSSSKDKLPQINTDLNIDIRDYKKWNLDDFNTNLIINSFDKETVILEISNSDKLSGYSIKGNIILYSKNTLNITRDLKLNDVLILASSVNIASGFSGNIQIIAKENVTIEEEVSLKYPSSIYIKNDIDSISVKIDKNSKVVGGIVIDGNTYKGILKRQLSIAESAEIYGMVYCYGKTELKGKIVGSIYTDRFFLKTKSATYENVILNGIIDSNSLPENFINPPIFNTKTGNYNYAIVKEF